MRARLTIALTCIAACALVFAAQAHAVFPGKNGKVAYEFGHARIYAVDPDGGNLTSLFDDAYHYPGNPAWSPDGTKIAFRGYPPTPSGRALLHVYTVNPDGTGLTNLTSDFSQAGAPDWSPDGKRIAFYGSPDPSTLELYSMNSDGTDRVPLTFTGGDI